ncbi:MAG TPA: trigger factor [Candidatus Paceibacterota bacterium]|jgi:FKBP-type peptidyl-prolyl cis-trans isomerase (trigger factor)|nr:trigger factor [Candidatus Paceibacterota bacterium]
MADDSNQKNHSNIKVTELPNSEVEIEGEVTAEKLEKARGKAVTRLSQTLKIPGFRPGHTPEKVIIQHIGEYPILEDAAEIALTEEYPLILAEHGIDALGRPDIAITKLAAGNPLGFKIKTAVNPRFALPDYKKIAKEKNVAHAAPDVSEKEIDEAIERIRHNKAHLDLHKKLGTDLKNHEHEEIKAEDLPPLDDEFAKSIGDYATLADLRAKMKESLVKEKEYEAREKTRIDIVESIIAATEIPLPEVLVDSELQKMLGQLKEDVSRTGLSYEEYLKQINKSEDDLKKEWRETAEKKAKFQLILNKIADTEHIEPDMEVLEHESKQLMDMYKDADPMRIRVYVATLLINEAVLKFLEEQS